MVASVKPPTSPPHPKAITPKMLELTKDNRDFLLGLHRQMQLIRRFEERTQEQYTKAKIGGYCHLNIGEEATVVGGILPLQLNDYIFTSYREHGHAIARGIDPKAVMAELFGKETGTSHGRGGSMHMFDADLRFMGGYGIVGGHLPLAVGGGWAVRYQEGEGRRLLHVRRRRHEHRRLPRVAQLLQGLQAAGGLVLRQQPLRHGHARSRPPPPSPTSTRRRARTTWSRSRSTA